MRMRGLRGTNGPLGPVTILLGGLLVLGAARPAPAQDNLYAMPPLADEWSLSLADRSEHITGNAKRYELYRQWPQGVYAPSLGYLHPVGPDGWGLELELNDFWEPTRNGDLWLVSARDRLSLGLDYLRTTSYWEWNPDSPLHRRRESGGRVGVDLGRGHLQLGLADQTVGRQMTPGGDTATDWSSTVLDGGYAFPLGPVRAAVKASRENFSEPGTGLFSGSTSTYRLTLEGVATDRLALEGWFDVARTTLEANVGGVTETRMGARGSAWLRDDLLTTGVASADRTGSSIARNGYAKEKLTGALSGTWAPSHQFRLRSSIQVMDVDYVTQHQTQTVSPTLTTFDVDVLGRPCRQVRLTGLYRQRSIDGAPHSFTTGDETGPVLFWSRTDRTRLGLNYTPTPRYGGTVTWQRDRWANAEVGTETQISTRDATAWALLGSDVTATVAWLGVDYHLAGFEAWALPAYTHSTTSLLASATWQVCPLTTFSASWGQMEARGAAEVREDIWSAEVAHRIGRDGRLRVGARFDDFDDAIAPLYGYGADALYVEYGHTF